MNNFVKTTVPGSMLSTQCKFCDYVAQLMLDQQFPTNMPTLLGGGVPPITEQYLPREERGDVAEMLVPMIDPVSRFEEIITTFSLNVDTVLESLEEGLIEVVELSPISKLLIKDVPIKLWKITGSGADFISALGLTPGSTPFDPPVPAINFTTEHLARLVKIYADDILMYNAATTTGVSYSIPDTVTFATYQERALARFASIRYSVEHGGTMLGDMHIRTDTRTRAAIALATIEANNNPAYVVSDWKIDNGTFVELDATLIKAIYEAIIGHIAACFTREKELSDMISTATTVEELDALVW